MKTEAIAAADVNSDGYIDIIIGNSGQENQNHIVMNNGDGDPFQEGTVAVALPGGDMDTAVIAAADINGDGYIDIIIGNIYQANQVIMNNGKGGGDVDPFQGAVPLALPGGSMVTVIIVAADVNGDGHIDIVIGNWAGENQVIMNNGKGRGDLFRDAVAVTLSGGDINTFVITAVDVNGDGHIDIIVGNYRQENQIVINNGKGDIDPFQGAVPVVKWTQCPL